MIGIDTSYVRFVGVVKVLYVPCQWELLSPKHSVRSINRLKQTRTATHVPLIPDGVLYLLALLNRYMYLRCHTPFFFKSSSRIYARGEMDTKHVFEPT